MSQFRVLPKPRPERQLFDQFGLFDPRQRTSRSPSSIVWRPKGDSDAATLWHRRASEIRLQYPKTSAISVTSIAAPVASGGSGRRVELASTGKHHLTRARTHRRLSVESQAVPLASAGTIACKPIKPCIRELRGPGNGVSTDDNLPSLRVAQEARR